MLSVIGLSIVGLMAIVTPIAFFSLVLLFVHLNRHRKIGYVYLMPYAVLLVIGVDAFTSGRVLDEESQMLHTEVVRGSLSAWMIRLSTALLLAASLERIGHFFAVINLRHYRHKLLFFSFILCWICSVGLSVFSAHPSFSHEYLYSLIFGVALLVISEQEIIMFFNAMRTALLIFIAFSFFLIVIKPSVVLQLNYGVGLIPGLPRMAGLSAHAVVFGVLTLISLVLNYKFPFQSKSLRLLGYSLSFAGFFMAQSKGAWVSGILVGLIFAYYHGKSKIEAAKTKGSMLPIALVAVFFLSISSLTVSLYAGGLSEKIDKFLNTKDGAQLMTLTGRDIIWEFALSEWHKYPIFGYGPTFLSLDQRLAVGLSSATHAHNQFVDWLARSGLIGLFGGIFYLLVVLRKIWEVDKHNQDISIVMFLIVINRCISEVPLNLYGYGHEFLINMMMLTSLLVPHLNKSINQK